MNAGGLALSGGVLYWGLDLGRGAVRAFDLDGRALSPRLDLGPGSSVSGLATDGDRRLWVADTRRGAVRGLNLFGFEGAEFEPACGPLEEPAGGLTDGPVDVALAPSHELLGLWVAVGGTRKQAVGLFLPDGTRLAVLRTEGDPKRPFDRVTRLATAGECLALLEAGRGRVQVFRRGDFHFGFAPGGGDLSALALLTDGRLLVAHGQGTGERVTLFSAAGRERAVLVAADGDPDAGRGSVEDCVDLVVEERPSDRESRLFVLDRMGARVQVFNLEGRCYGALPLFGEAQASGDSITDL